MSIHVVEILGESIYCLTDPDAFPLRDKARCMLLSAIRRGHQVVRVEPRAG